MRIDVVRGQFFFFTFSPCGPSREEVKRVPAGRGKTISF